MSPRPRVPASPRPRITASPRHPASPRRRVPASPRPRVPASPRPRVPASPRLVQVAVEPLADTRVTQAAEGIGLDLAGALAGDPEGHADFLQSAALAIQ